MLDPKKKKKVERILKEQNLLPEHSAIGKLVLAVEEKVDLLQETLDNIVKTLNEKKE